MELGVPLLGVVLSALSPGRGSGAPSLFELSGWWHLKLQSALEQLHLGRCEHGLARGLGFDTSYLPDAEHHWKLTSLLAWKTQGRSGPSFAPRPSMAPISLRLKAKGPPWTAKGPSRASPALLAGLISPHSPITLHKLSLLVFFEKSRHRRPTSGPVPLLLLLPGTPSTQICPFKALGFFSTITFFKGPSPASLQSTALSSPIHHPPSRSPSFPLDILW